MRESAWLSTAASGGGGSPSLPSRSPSSRIALQVCYFHYWVITMTLRKGREPSQSIEALAWYSQFDTPTTGMGATVQDLQRRQAAVDRLKTGMDESLANEARLHGWRVQNLFEAMIVCLGSIRLIMTEDAGSYYYNEDAGAVKPPDFRVVRSDGQQVLIEVKNVDPRTYKEALVNERDLKQKQQYADLMATRLLLAHYWSAANHWSVVDPRVLERRDGKLVLRFETAMMANELGLMGDSMIGTRPPLTLSLIADPSQPQRARQISRTEEELGFKIGGVELSCGGQVLTTAREQRIAWFLMFYGHWEVNQDLHFDGGGRLERLNFQVTPPVPAEESGEAIGRQGVEIVGHLSEMYSTYYNLMTLAETGEVQQLRHEPDPGVLAGLIPSDYWSSPGRDLPIWQFVVRPSVGPASGNVTGP